MKIIRFLIKQNVCYSTAEAKRLIHSGLVSIDNKLVNNEDIILEVGSMVDAGKNHKNLTVI
jgi:tyrosyl-tRNA synthetase